MGGKPNSLSKTSISCCKVGLPKETISITVCPFPVNPFWINESRPYATRIACGVRQVLIEWSSWGQISAAPFVGMAVVWPGVPDVGCGAIVIFPIAQPESNKTPMIRSRKTVRDTNWHSTVPISDALDVAAGLPRLLLRIAHLNANWYEKLFMQSPYYLACIASEC